MPEAVSGSDVMLRFFVQARLHRAGGGAKQRPGGASVLNLHHAPCKFGPLPVLVLILSLSRMPNLLWWREHSHFRATNEK